MCRVSYAERVLRMQVLGTVLYICVIQNLRACVLERVLVQRRPTRGRQGRDDEIGEREKRQQGMTGRGGATRMDAAQGNHDVGKGI